ncbi:LysE family translocator [Atlantibacter hermannii]|uniref:LysE family translocator n=1 Tax=Atlantibacter hermannii TaxID=565 RepID=UPI0028A20749|nr:LysE family translocator [Atlantibacter hermannii]MCQ4966905.1 LysE family translocator [Enterobacteriaceae bacterium DFI.7.85]
MDINITGFMLVLLPVALSPGASFTLVINSALTGGRAGLWKTLAGTALGIYTHALLIGFGITAVVVSSPAIFGVLKAAGTAYLIWLGVMLIRSGLQARRHLPPPRHGSITLRAAWLANIINPKAIIFYLTVVSQFAGAHGSVASYLVLASVHVAVMGLWLVTVSRTLVFSARKRDPAMLKKTVNIAGGALLIIFALHSLFS